ncbi:MAG: hypothetical protein GEU75_08055 [Dehalococcoidia bacterium]|nr:hypothetical protein [Dehalococcoidia bacterium]
MVLTGLASWPLALGVLGAVLNGAVALVNRGRIPVIGIREDQELADPRQHMVANSDHRLLVLADRIPLGPFLRASPGDVLLALGALLPILFFLF